MSATEKSARMDGSAIAGTSSSAEPNASVHLDLADRKVVKWASTTNDKPVVLSCRADSNACRHFKLSSQFNSETLNMVSSVNIRKKSDGYASRVYVYGRLVGVNPGGWGVTTPQILGWGSW